MVRADRPGQREDVACGVKRSRLFSPRLLACLFGVAAFGATQLLVDSSSGQRMPEEASVTEMGSSPSLEAKNTAAGVIWTGGPPPATEAAISVSSPNHAPEAATKTSPSRRESKAAASRSEPAEPGRSYGTANQSSSAGGPATSTPKAAATHSRPSGISKPATGPRSLFRPTPRPTPATSQASPVSSLTNIAPKSTASQPAAVGASKHRPYAPATAGSVAVWHPHTRACAGKFVTDDSERRGLQPLLMLREASVDFRHNSIREFKMNRRDGGADKRLFRRVTLQVSVAWDAELVGAPWPGGSQDAHGTALPSASIGVEQRDTGGGESDISGEGWSVEFSYVLEEPHCANRRCHDTPVPGHNTEDRSRTTYMCTPRETQLIVSITPPRHVATEDEFAAELTKLERRAAYLRLTLPVRLNADRNAQENQELSLSLGCISGLTASTALLPHLAHLEGGTKPYAPPNPSCEQATGSVIVAGAPLFDSRRDTEGGRRGVAHFAARALFGSVQFDTVAVPVLTPHSMSEILARCASNVTCIDAYQGRNEQLLSAVAGDVEKELRELGVPGEHWRRILLFPFCRLGTDHFDGGHERRHACYWFVCNTGECRRWGPLWTLYSDTGVAPRSFPQVQVPWSGEGVRATVDTAVVPNQESLLSAVLTGGLLLLFSCSTL